MENSDADRRSDSSSARIDDAWKKINFEKALYGAETMSSASDDDLSPKDHAYECELYT